MYINEQVYEIFFFYLKKNYITKIFVTFRLRRRIQVKQFLNIATK